MLKKMLFTVISIMAAFFAVNCHDFKIVNAATLYGFSDTDYEQEIGNRPRTDKNKQRYPFITSEVTISTPELKKTKSGLFQIVYRFGYPITKGGADRFLEYRVKFSDDLQELVSGISVDPVGAKADPSPPKSKQKYNFNDRVRTDSDGRKVFSSGVYLGGGYNGGDAIVYVTLKRSFVLESSFISSYMLSNTEASRPVYPAFEALRNMDYIKFGIKYNESLLKSEKEKNISDMQEAYNDLVKKINAGSLSQSTKNSAVNKIKDILNSATQSINSQNKFENKVLDDMDDIEKKAVSDMNKVLDGLSDVSITKLPNLNFGENIIQSQKIILESIDNQQILGNIFSFNKNIKKNLAINLSISEFYLNKSKLNAKVLFNNQEYNSNTSFIFYQENSNFNGPFSINKTPQEGVKILVNPGSALIGKYRATATWTITTSPVN